MIAYPIVALSPGTRLGPYEVTAQIGVGGMGEVYRATDTSLGRQVAIKVLPEAFAQDADRLARFAREAKTLASLNHPNIAQIYGLETAAPSTRSASSGSGQAVHAIVMELAEGPTLWDRIARGPMPLDEALPIAKQIALALEAAHEQGIIHRDLKPANIKLRPDGTVKVLDFGLAKVLEPAGVAHELSQSPTITTPAATRMGVVMGTPAYMAPEQASGRAVDRRSDIWSFGCVLFEMLTGRRAFGGEDVTATLASIITKEPDWTALPGNTPPPIRRLLRRCLQKDAKVRLHDMADIRIELDDASSVSDIVAPDRQRGLRRWERLAWTGALVMIAFAAAMTIRWGLARTPVPSELRLEITTPPTTDPTAFAVSPDGSTIVFAAAFEGQDRLLIRSLDSTSTRPLPGTDRASYPFWKPDGRSIGFFADGQLKRIDVDGGSVQVLAPVVAGRGGSWSRDDVILFVPANGSGVSRVSAGGGPVTSVTRVETPRQTGHRLPQLLPDGGYFLYYVGGIPEARGVYVARLDGASPQRLIDADAAAVYASSGHLLFVRGGALFARRFDPGTRALTGDAFPLAAGIAVDAATSIAAISTSAAGPVVYRSGTLTNRRQFVWFDRAGTELERVGDADSAALVSAAVSKDARHVVLPRMMNGNIDLWQFETARPIPSRFTSDPAVDINPMWSPDGTRVVFSSARSGAAFDLYEKAANAGLGAEKPIRVTSQSDMQSELATDWSSDGRFLLYGTVTRGVSNYDLWAVDVDGSRTPISVVQTSYDEKDGQFSPDGKWVAYQSNESGSFEIYLQSFPGQAAKRRVSANGGAQVRWRPDSTELFYIALDGRLMAVPLRLLPGGQTLEPGTPVPLFVTRVGGAVPNLLVRQQYAVSSDGRRFLMHTITDDAAAPLTVILNWKPS